MQKIMPKNKKELDDKVNRLGERMGRKVYDKLLEKTVEKIIDEEPDGDLDPSKLAIKTIMYMHEVYIEKQLN